MTDSMSPATAPSSLDRFIVSTADIRGGRPRIDGTRITVGDVATWRLKLGYSAELIAGIWALSRPAVYAALAYYYDHKAEIDARQAEDNAFTEAFRKANPSPLQQKLQRLQVE